MLEFLIIWSAAIREDNFYVIRSTINSYKQKLGLAKQVSLVYYHLATLSWLNPGWGERALI